MLRRVDWWMVTDASKALLSSKRPWNIYKSARRTCKKTSLFSSAAVRTSHLVLYLYIAVYLGLLRVCTFPVVWYLESYKTLRHQVKGCVGAPELSLIAVHNCLSGDSQQPFLPSYPFTVGREHPFPQSLLISRIWGHELKSRNFVIFFTVVCERRNPLEWSRVFFYSSYFFCNDFHLRTSFRAPKVCFRHW
jgi:hypothetical protein